MNKSEVDLLLAEKDEEIMLLQQQLDSETRRAAMAESELKLALAASRKAEEAHVYEVAKVEADVKQVLAERRTLLQKLQSIEVVEDSVRELYVQMKDRIASDGTPTPEQLQREKEALQGENILVVLGSLHALLKTLWAFKVEAEDDLRATRLARAQRQEDSALSLRASIRELESELRTAQQEAAAATLQAELEAEAKQCLLDESQAVVNAMSAQHHELLAALKGAMSEHETLKKALEEAQAEGKRRDGLILANRQLESARHFDRAAQDKELRRMQVEHNRQMGAMQEELRRISELMAQNAVLQEQLRRATEQARVLKRDAKPQARHQLEKQVAELKVQLEAEKQAAAQRQLAVPSEAGSPRPSTAPMSRAASEALSQSMARKATNLMHRMHDKVRMAELAAEAERNMDPLAGVLTNVGAMHKQAKAALRDTKRELAEGPTAARRKDERGDPQATQGLVQKAQASRGLGRVWPTGPDGAAIWNKVSTAVKVGAGTSGVDRQHSMVSYTQSTLSHAPSTLSHAQSTVSRAF